MLVPVMITTDADRSTAADIPAEILAAIVHQPDAFFRSQQKDEADLSAADKIQIVSDLFRTNKSLFLQRYGRYLTEQHLGHFETEPELFGQLSELRRTLRSGPNRLVRNRRYQAMQKLLADGMYFSDSEMQSRNPYLFDQMVGRYMTDAEKTQLRRETYITNYGEANFSSYLLETDRQARMQNDSQAERERFDDVEQSPSTPITDEEKKLLRNEFLELMMQDFLNGKDGHHYDYRLADENPDFDEESDRDQEERYFDASD